MIRSPTPLLNTKLKELPKNTTKRDLTKRRGAKAWTMKQSIHFVGPLDTAALAHWPRPDAA